MQKHKHYETMLATLDGVCEVERLRRAAAVLGFHRPVLSRRPISYILTLVLAAALLPSGSAIAAGNLTNASVGLSDPRVSQSSNYTFTGSSVDIATAILCVKVVWSTTSGGDTAPAGFSGVSGSVTAASSTLINSSAINWSLAKSDGTGSGGQNNIYKYTNSASGVTPGGASGRTFVLAGLTNPSTPATQYFFKINTYGNTDCTSSPIDNATVQFINSSGSLMSMTIDPVLNFSVGAVDTGQSCDGTTTTAASTSSTLPFGTVSSAAHGVVCQDLQASTNAPNGYTIYLRYTGALSDGFHNISSTSGSNSVPAAFSAGEAYGYATNDSSLTDCGSACNTDRFTNPSQGWAAATTSNAEIGYEAAGVSTAHYLIGHQVGITTTTPNGSYSTTIVYTCTPVY